ncbi:MAG: formylglycine-generating enzyme family protein [Phycisphaerae bacterium]|nr:formylglycine-generating enzyme family protein [Phycisphaerae bacterium]
MRRFSSLPEILVAGLIVGLAAIPIPALWSSDFDSDSDVDLTDFSGFTACFNGPNRAPAAFCAVDADLDDDTDVDLADFGVFAACFNGPNRPPACTTDPPPPGMVLILAGEFQMGDTFNDGPTDGRELPVHAVYVDGFYIDQYEVTNQQYADALNWANGQGGHITVAGGVVYKYSGTTYPYCETTTTTSNSRITWNGSAFGVTAGKENHPMVNVSWYGAVAYANWRSGMQDKPLCYSLSTWECNWNDGYRLPTEAEWEKAARGGVAGQRFPWGNTVNHDHTNYWACGSCYSYDTSPYSDYTFHPDFDDGGTPHTGPVGYFAPNGHGLYDMAGNLHEWCNDRWGSFYYSSSPYDNPRGPTSGPERVIRGGNWASGADECRSAFRRSGLPTATGEYSRGFRCAAGSP